MVYGSSALPGGELLTLVSVMDTLRRHCPWDARQTHESLAPYLLEESYEALDALESGDRAALREELGDVLLQVMFHARVAAERSDGTGFTVDDVADGIVTKLVRRHPHVFGRRDRVRRGRRDPQLGRDQGGRAGRPATGPPRPWTGCRSASPRWPWPPSCSAAPSGPACPRSWPAPEAGGPAGSRLGAELFALVARGPRGAGLDPELELRAAARRYGDLVRRWEAGHQRSDRRRDTD